MSAAPEPAPPPAPPGDRPSVTLHSPDVEATRRIGERLARALRPGDVLLLHGDLGAGKTALTQGIGRGLGVADRVQSPTFTLVNEYGADGRVPGITHLYHLDLYRLGGPDDLESIAFDDYLAAADGVTVVEWPERAGRHLPDAYLLVGLEILPDGRRLTFEAIPAGGPARPILDALTAAGPQDEREEPAAPAPTGR